MTTCVNRDARSGWGGLSPLGWGALILRLSLPRRGVWIQHLARQRPAPGRRSQQLGDRDPGGPVRSPSGVLQQCRALQPAASVERIRRPTLNPSCGAAGEWRIPKCGQGRKSPNAGAGRQPPGREALRTRKVLEEAPRKASWSRQRLRGCRVGTRVPFLELTPAARGSQEETARAQVDGRRHKSPKVCRAFGSSCLTRGRHSRQAERRAGIQGQTQG